MSNSPSLIDLEVFRTSPNDRPEDLANRYVYATQQYRTVRFVIEADVDWRDDDPDYCLSVAALAAVDSDRIHGTKVVSTEIVSESHTRSNPWDSVLSKLSKES